MGNSKQADQIAMKQEAIIHEQYDVQEGMEILKRREESVKHFDLGGGRRQAVVYPEAVHYKERGAWKEIDNNLEAVSREGKTLLCNRANALRVELPQRADQGALVTLRNKGKSLSWRFIHQAQAVNAEVRNGVELRRERLLSLAKENSLFKARSASTLSDNELNGLQNARERRLDRSDKHSRACFDNLLPGVSVKYSLSGNQLKEDIILQNKAALSLVALAMDCDLDLRVNSDCSMTASDPVSGEAVFCLRAPIAYDADGTELAVSANLADENGQTVLRYTIPDAEMDDAVYPITIDPVVTLNPTQTDRSCAMVKSNGGKTTGDIAQMDVGKGTAGYENIILLRFNTLASIEQCDTVVKAQLRMTATSTSGTNRYTSVCEVTDDWDQSSVTYSNVLNKIAPDEMDYRIGGSLGKRLDFDITNLYRKWAKNANDNHGVALRRPQSMPNADNYQKLFGWGASNSDYKPFMIINYVSHAGIEGWWQYESESVGRAGTANVDLFNGSVIVSHQDTAMSGANTSVSVSHFYNSCPPEYEGAGSGSDESGSGTTVITMPDYHCGVNWKLSVQQFLYETTLKRTNGDNIDYLVWVDGDGTEHYFKKSQATPPYRDREGMGLTLELLDADSSFPKRYVLRNRQGISMSFEEKKFTTSANEKARWWLRSIFKTGMRDNTLAKITYYGESNDPDESITTQSVIEGRITKITDAANRVTTFGYNSSNRLSSITIPGFNNNGTTNKTVEYKYSGGYLTDINYSDLGSTTPQTKYTYGSGTQANLLTRMTNYDGNYISITYNAGRAASLEHNAVNINGKRLQFDYEDMKTVVTVDDGVNSAANKKLIYQFNDRGNVVAMLDELGYAHFAQYEDDDSNAQTESSRVQRTVINKLRKPDLTDLGAGSGYTWATSGIGKIERNKDEECLNAASVKIARTTGGSESKVTQSGISLNKDSSKAKMWTFSAYVKATGNSINAFIRAKVNNTNYTSEVITAATTPAVGNDLPTDGWERVQVSFSIPAGTGALTAQVDMVSSGGASDVYFACPQLEQGDLANSVNLLSNGDFSAIENGLPKDWTAGANIVTNSSNTGYEGPYVRTPGANGIPALPEALAGNVVRIVGKPNQDSRNFSQQIKVIGKKNDLFFVGGWVHAKSVPGANSDERGLRLLVKFRKDGSSGTWNDSANVPFNYSWVDWQCVGGPVKAPFDYDMVQVYVVYIKNLNEACFTNIFLFREAYGKSFGYDANKNLTAMSTLAGTQTQMEYDTQDNLIGYTPAGRTSNYAKYTLNYGDTTSDKKMHLLRRIDAPEGIRTGYEYDAYGNRTVTRVRPTDNDNLKIETTTAYGGTNNNYVSGVTDARGNVMTQETNDNTCLVTKRTAPNGLMTNYTYDVSDRLKSVSASTVESVTLQRNEYDYDKDRLKTIKHNTSNSASDDVIYHLEYNNLGAQTCVKVGTTVLSENVYSSDRSHKLTQVNYGVSGTAGKVRYAYDDFDRLIGVAYDGVDPSTSPAYTYSYGANGAVGRVRDNILNREHTTQYDLAGRPMQTLLTDTSGASLYKTWLKYNKFGKLEQFAERVNGAAIHKSGYTYLKNDSVEKIEYDSANQSVAYVYDKLGRVTTRTIRNGTSANTYATGYTYIAGATSGKTTNLVRTLTQAGLNFMYEYDNMGNIIKEWRYIGSDPDQNQVAPTVMYEYDKLGQLIRVNDKSDNTVNNGNGTTWVYAYDLGGNIKSKTYYAYTTAAVTAITPQFTYVYGDANWKDKLTSYNGGAITYGVGDIGNPIGFNGWTLAWQHGRQLASMSKAERTLRFYYDAGGLRTRKVDSVEGTTDYTLHGKLITHLKKGNNNLHFFYDAQSRPAMVDFNGTIYTYAHNLQGDIIAILDSSNTKVVEYKYDAWGKPTGTTLATGSTSTLTAEYATLAALNPFRYCGYVWDDETDLYYLRSRYYNPEWGRFLNADIRLGICGKIFTHNIFAYCSNSFMVSDPDGKESEDIWDFWYEPSRLMWRIFGNVYGGLKNYTLFRDFLAHSLQQNPPDLVLGEESQAAAVIREDAQFREKFSKLVTELDENGYASGKMRFTNNNDLLLAFRNVDISVQQIEEHVFQVMINDKYDFDWEPLNSILNVGVNMARLAQGTAIKSYYITISFTERIR